MGHLIPAGTGARRLQKAEIRVEGMQPELRK
jgi:hypothetical protein